MCLVIHFKVSLLSGCASILHAPKKYRPNERPENAMSIINNLEQALTEGWLLDEKFYTESTLLDFIGGECVRWNILVSGSNDGTIKARSGKKCALTAAGTVFGDNGQYASLSNGNAQICITLYGQGLSFFSIRDRFVLRWGSDLNSEHRAHAISGRIYRVPVVSPTNRKRFMFFYFDREYIPLSVCAFDTEI